MNKEIIDSLSINRDINIGARTTARGNARFLRNVKIEGWLDAPNVMGPCRGLYSDTEQLNEAYPNPRPGWWALVTEDSAVSDEGILRADVYVSKQGRWEPTTATAVTLRVDLLSLRGEIADKADRREFMTLSEDEYDELSVKDINTYYFLYE